MSYIYDILINFNKQLVDFYDWNLNDTIEHVRKIPLFRIDSKSLLEIRNSVVEIDQKVMDLIFNKTEVFHNHNVGKMAYCCLFSDGAYVLGVQFNQSGVSVAKSKLLLDEEIEVIDVCERMEEETIDYEILMDDMVYECVTRKEMKVRKYLLLEIRKGHNLDKLRYLYFDCYGEQEDDERVIMKRFRDTIQDNKNGIVDKMYQFFKLTSTHK